MKKYDVIAATGTYMKDGEEKTAWTRCGAVFEKNGKFSLKMDVFPVGGEGWFSLSEPRQKQAPQQSYQAPPQQDPNDDIPF